LEIYTENNNNNNNNNDIDIFPRSAVDDSLEKMLKNKYFARNLIEKLIDINQDGYVSINELLQPMDSES